MKNKKKMIFNSVFFTFFIIVIISLLDIHTGLENVSYKLKYVSNIYKNYNTPNNNIPNEIQGVEFIKNENGKLEAIIKEKFWFPWSQMVVTYEINRAISSVDVIEEINENEWNLGDLVYKSISNGREFKSILKMN